MEEFRPIRRQKASDLIVEEIWKMILEGKLKPGDRLPPEHTLVERFQVSKVTLREALQTLETYGHITRKPGRGGGTIVLDIAPTRGIGLLANYMNLSGLSVEALMQARLLIEPLIAERIRTDKLHYMGGIHAVEHAAISMFPLFALCDRNDIGGIASPHHPQVGKSAIIIYDGFPGGIGLAARLQGSRAPWMIGALYLASPVVLVYMPIIGTEPLHLLLTTYAALLLVLGVRRHSATAIAGSGLLTGIAALTRPIGIIPVLVGVLLLACSIRRPLYRSRVLVWTLSACLLPLVWSVSNGIKTGFWGVSKTVLSYPSSVLGGQYLEDGVEPIKTSAYDEHGFATGLADMAMAVGRNPLRASAASPCGDHGSRAARVAATANAAAPAARPST